MNKLEITADKQFLAAAGNPSIKIFEVNSSNSQPLHSYDGHTGNVTAVGFQKDSKWMFRCAICLTRCHPTSRGARQLPQALIGVQIPTLSLCQRRDTALRSLRRG